MKLTGICAGWLALLLAVQIHLPQCAAQKSRFDELGAQITELTKHGKYAEALPPATEFLKLAEQTQPQDPALVNIAITNLADVYNNLGRYSEAEPFYLRALSMDEKELGPDDSEVAADLDNLGALYNHMHRNADAEPLFLRALAIDEKAKDVDEHDFSKLLSDAASLYQDEGNYAQAESLYRRGLAIDHKLFGDESLDVAADLINFAGLFDEEGKFAEAEQLYKAALSIDEKALDPDDPSLATDLNNLADHYRLVGDPAQAEQLCLHALKIREKAFGPDSPDVAGTLNILALLYQQERRFAEAEPLLERSLKIREKVFGTDNSSFATGLNNLASLDEDLRQYEKAEALYRRSLGILEKSTEPGSPDLEKACFNLAVVLADQSKVSEAEPLFERGFSSLFARFQSNFTFMTEKERLGFLDLVSYDFRRYFSFVHSFRAQDPALIGSMYNLLLWQKGFIAGSVTNMRRQVEASGDAQALKLLGDLTAKRTQLAALLSVPAPMPNRGARKSISCATMQTGLRVRSLPGLPLLRSAMRWTAPPGSRFATPSSPARPPWNSPDSASIRTSRPTVPTTTQHWWLHAKPRISRSTFFSATTSRSSPMPFHTLKIPSPRADFSSLRKRQSPAPTPSISFGSLSNPLWAASPGSTCPPTAS